MPEDIKEDLATLIEYNWEDEREHWEEDGMPENHIFNNLNRLNTWLSQNR